MRTRLVLGVFVLLTGCAGLPAPDPNQAWVALAPNPDEALHAVQVDDREWAEPRYFEVQPGSHELTVRYQFPVTPSNIGADSEPLWRDCQLNVKFEDFSAGQRYQLEAGSIGFHPWAKLYDEQRNLVSQGLPAGCQRT